MTATDPTLAALLRAVLARPDDDLPRLVLADWLEEKAGTAVACGVCGGLKGHIHILGGGGHESPANAMAEGDYWAGSGRGYRAEVNSAWKKCSACRGTGRVPDGRSARAEFIRVQCELATSAGQTCRLFGTENDERHARCDDCPGCRKTGALRRRERELQRIGDKENWLSRDIPFTVLPDTPRFDGVFRRGFVAEISLPWNTWRQHAAALLDACPIRGAKDGLVRLATWPDVGQDKDHVWFESDGRRWNKWGDLNARLGDSVSELLLRAEYPGVRFELPAAGRGEAWRGRGLTPAEAEVVRAAGESYRRAMRRDR